MTPISTYPVFTLGFRAFFLLASFAALALLILWQQMTQNAMTPPYFSGNYWHSHEMLLGYTVAVISGFLLTAVSNWTGKITLQGEPLVGLSLLWLYGRILPFYAGLLPDGLIALVDISFLPALTFIVARALFQAKQYKNLVFVGLLLFLIIGNVLIHSEMLKLCENSAQKGIELVLATVILIILIIAGRVFPFFIEKGLKGVLIPRNKIVELLAIGSAVSVFIAQIFCNVSGSTLAFLALVTAGLNSWRLVSWFVFRIWFVPLLWVFCLGYAWVIFGFVLMAFAEWQWVASSLALHAFTVGGIGVLTIGMMARVSLGHTGRAMKASNTITVAFGLINLAALCRVFLPAAIMSWSNMLIYCATLAWLAAFALFVFIYTPILVAERDNEK